MAPASRIAVGARAPDLLTRAALAVMLARRWGRVINFAALAGLTRALAAEVARVAGRRLHDDATSGETILLDGRTP